MNAISIPYFEIAAFAGETFAGNQAGVCVLGEWLPERTLQAIAAQNNLSETAFAVQRGHRYDLRWFTPTLEAELCGHATLAMAHVLFHHLGIGGDTVCFDTQAGSLSVTRESDRLVLDFPSQPPTPSHDSHRDLINALGATPQFVFRDRDYLAVFGTAEEIEQLRPSIAAIAELNVGAVIVTAPGTDYDFVSRYFAPGFGIPEDPVTGSIHCALIPYWSERLGKQQLHARQLSTRGGELFCEDRGDRVSIGGTAVTYLVGNIYVPASSIAGKGTSPTKRTGVNHLGALQSAPT
ncbi:MAG: PhzF family phenazine biosynthesis protein [Chthoniobacterales bacterium]